MSQHRTEQARKAQIRRAWKNWFLMFVPLFVPFMLAIFYFGFWTMLPVMLGGLIVMLLYQRYVKKRSWHSIMWGVYARRD